MAWEEPIPFDTIDTPNFPVESLPGPLSAFVECLAESTQTPEEMAGILSLGVLATAFQSKYEVEVTPDWREPLCLYPVAVAPPGERKSAVISALTKPIYEYEAERRQAEAVEIEQNRTERNLLEKALQAAQARATKGKKADLEVGREEALALSAELAQFQDKHPFRLLADDTTPEKLVDIMDTQNGCITVSSAEGGIFDSMAGRYDKGANFDVYLKGHVGDGIFDSMAGRYDKGANFDVYLKGHVGDPITVDRVGRRQNRIDAPRLTMILTIQPEVLGGLMSNATMRGRGLCGRFLYAMCKSKVGQRAVSPPPVPDTVKADYRSFVRRILADPGAGTIRLSPEADGIRKQYQEHIEAKLGNEWEFMRDWGCKLVGAMVRIAALMHAAQVQGDPAEITISSEVMASAVSIAEFLGEHATAAYQIMGADESQSAARYILKRLSMASTTRITRSELTRLCRGRFNRSDDMDPALKVLEERGYIREVESDVGYNNRTKTAYLINPAIAGIDGKHGNDAA